MFLADWWRDKKFAFSSEDAEIPGSQESAPDWLIVDIAFFFCMGNPSSPRPQQFKENWGHFRLLLITCLNQLIAVSKVHWCSAALPQPFQQQRNHSQNSPPPHCKKTFPQTLSPFLHLGSQGQNRFLNADDGINCPIASLFLPHCVTPLTSPALGAACESCRTSSRKKQNQAEAAAAQPFFFFFS